jgi:hypothetical protein
MRVHSRVPATTRLKIVYIRPTANINPRPLYVMPGNKKPAQHVAKPAKKAQALTNTVPRTQPASRTRRRVVTTFDPVKSGKPRVKYAKLSDGTEVTNAPVAVDTGVRHHVSFQRGEGDDSIRTRFRIPFVEVGYGEYAAHGSIYAPLNAGATGQAVPHMSIQLCSALMPGLYDQAGDANLILTNHHPLSPILKLLGVLFTKYRMHRLKFIYEAQGPTDESIRYALAYSADPMHPILWTAGPDAPTFATLQSMNEAVNFTASREFELDVSHMCPKKWLYTSSNNTDSANGNFNAFNQLLDARFSSFGVLSIMQDVDVPSLANAVKTGVLYMEADVEFSDFAPLIADASGIGPDFANAMLIGAPPASIEKLCARVLQPSDPEKIRFDYAQHPDLEAALASLDHALRLRDLAKDADARAQPMFWGAVAKAASQALPLIMNVMSSLNSERSALASEDGKEQGLLSKLMPLLQDLLSQANLSVGTNPITPTALNA